LAAELMAISTIWMDFELGFLLEPAS
jgi:hypothetical protein